MLNKKILAIIGARSGSKGLKDKNILKIKNKPLIGWIISSAKKSKYINRVVLSTDSLKYKRIAEKYGAEVPVIRPSKLAKDTSREIEFINHALSWLKKNQNYIPDIVVRLLCTCPFQKSSDIDRIIKKILYDGYNSAVIISKAKQHPEKALKISGTKNKKIVSYINEKGTDVGSNNNRQAYKQAFFRGNVIACKTSVINNFNSLTDNRVGYIIIPNKDAIDIDDELDFLFAKYLSKHFNI